MSVFNEAFWQMFGWVTGFFAAFGTLAAVLVAIILIFGGIAGALTAGTRRRLATLRPKRDNVVRPAEWQGPPDAA